MSSHRLHDGSWAECLAPEACELLFHVELSVTEVEAVPLVTLLPLFEAIKPPTVDRGDGVKTWQILETSKKRPNQGYHVQYHRDYDLPAKITSDGMLEWYWLGERHRDGDKPAVIFPDGSMEWWEHGTRARASGGPTQVDADGEQSWVESVGTYGLRYHREDDLPALIEADGSMYWYRHGNTHRDDDRPAIIHADGTREWFENGIRTRRGGPAVIDADGTEEWWLGGEQLSETMTELYKDEIRRKGGSW